jgi:hypothetical protein
MKKLTLSFTFLGMICLYACSSKQEAQMTKNYAEADTVAASYASPEPQSTESKTTKDNRKFLRTADLKFRTKDVRKATYLVEDLTRHFDGFITRNDLQSRILYQDKTQISADSLLEITTFNVEGNISIRVPNRNLDSLVRQLNQLIDYLDHRTVTAEDVNLTLLRNSLKINRLESFDKRNQQVNDSRKGDILKANTAEEDRLDRQMASDDYKINNKDLEDKVNYSTVSLMLYQREQVSKALLPNPKSIESYKPNLFLRVWNSIKDGWVIIEEIIVFLFKLWAVIFLGLGGYWIYRMSRPKLVKG